MPSRLRIGVNALYLIPGGVGGTEIYLRNLLGALSRIDRRNEYFLYLNRETGQDLCPQSANFATVETGVKASFRPGRLVWEQFGLPRAAMRDKIDVLFSPGFTSPWFSTSRRVTVIHDLQHRKQPENFGRLERWAWELSVRRSVERSHRLIAVSQASRADLIEAYGVPEERIRVIGHGVEPDFFGLWKNDDYDISILRAAGVPEGPFLLVVSTVHPHKNWRRLLTALKLLHQRGRELRLVVCGLPGKSWDEVQSQLESEGLVPHVTMLGWQPRKTLIALFRFAEALVFPSTFEGFGMPVLEALAAGTPVACSDIPPLREVADGCATFFDPLSTDSIASGMESVLVDVDERTKLAEQGLKRASLSTWDRAAEQTLETLLEAAKL